MCVSVFFFQHKAPLNHNIMCVIHRLNKMIIICVNKQKTYLKEAHVRHNRRKKLNLGVDLIVQSMQTRYVYLCLHSHLVQCWGRIVDHIRQECPHCWLWCWEIDKKNVSSFKMLSQNLPIFLKTCSQVIDFLQVLSQFLMFSVRHFLKKAVNLMSESKCFTIGYTLLASANFAAECKP